MLKYTINRILIGLLTIWVLITVVFFLMKILPGGPFDTDRVTDPRVIELIQKKYNLDKPAWQQYLFYMRDLMKGDMGSSFKKLGTDVTTLIRSLAPVTMRLGAVAFVVAVGVGIFLGIVAALTKWEWLKAFIVAIATFGISVPGFLLAIFLMYFFAVRLRLLPVIGLEGWKNYIMPALALSFYPIAYISRMTRSVLSEVLKQDYITMAKSKGISKTTVVLRHAMPNVLIPIVTYLGPMIAGLMTGSFVIENLFAIPGIGRELVTAVQSRDYPVILGLTIFFGGFIIIMNLIVDLLLGVIDPRIKLGEGKKA